MRGDIFHRLHNFFVRLTASASRTILCSSKCHSSLIVYVKLANVMSVINGSFRTESNSTFNSPPPWWGVIQRASVDAVWRTAAGVYHIRWLVWSATGRQLSTQPRYTRPIFISARNTEDSQPRYVHFDVCDTMMSFVRTCNLFCSLVGSKNFAL